MKENIEKLLSKLKDNKIQPTELKELDFQLNEAEIDSAYEHLEKLWNDYDEELSLDFQIHKNSIKKEIDYQTRGQKKGEFNIGRFHSFYWKAAAAIILLLSPFFSYQLFFNNESTDKVISIVSPAGQKSFIDLPDGSKVQLNSSSKLTYTTAFGPRNRVVELEGEAYFDVAKSKDYKFQVKTKFQNIEVMGTTFNVQSYSNERLFELTLLTGKVKVTNNSDPTKVIILNPNEKVTYNSKINNLSISPSNTNNETAWMRDELVFQEEPLSRVFSHLERFYGVNIQLNSTQKIEDEVFTGKFSRDNVEDVLLVLKELYPIEYTKTKKEISITLKSNNH